MRPTRPLYGMVLLCSSLLIVLTAGCPGGGIPDLQAPLSLDGALDTETLVGGNSQRLVFVREDYPDLPPVTLWDLITGSADSESLGKAVAVAPTIRVATVELVSLAVTPLTDKASFSPYSAVSDGRWLAWYEYAAYDVVSDSDAIQVLNLETGTQTSYFQGASSAPGIVALENGRLILSATRAFQTYVVVVDLASGEASLLPTTNPLGYYPQLVARGDWLAMAYDPPAAESAPASVEDLLGSAATSQPANVDEINLSTGQRATVTGVAADTLHLTDTQLIWTDSPDHWTTTIVHAQDLGGGPTRDVLTFDAAWTSVEDAGNPGIIVHRSSEAPDGLSSRELFELYAPNGRTLTILDSTMTTQGLLNPFPIWPEARIVGSLVVYRDPSSGGWVIYDPATEGRRTVKPFAP